MSTTIGQWLEVATATLAAASDQARADAEELLSRLLRRSRTELYFERETPVSTEQARTLERWLERRAAGKPVQYITGRAAFRGLDLAVTPAVLIPRPETERLVEAVFEVLSEQRARWPAPRVLDLGTGSGAIALALAEEWPAARVSASERSEQALEVARANAGERGLEARVRFLAGDWLDAVPGDERFEVIVSNPPYIAETERDALPIDVREHEPAAALFSGPTGLEALREIVDQSPRHLVAGGLLALELAEMRALEVRAWLDGARDWEEVALRDDLTGRPRILLARRQAGPAIAPAQWGEEG
jgi:release factor glutamine methyltransferase